MNPIITLLTDFGTEDPYVGVMKAALVGRCPDARLVDLTHNIERHQVGPASFWIERVHSYFPPGTVHLLVVDPGVGSARRPLAVRAGEQIFVAPDNGALSDVLRRYEGACDGIELKRSLINPDGKMGTTFDGRDLFAPAAGLLAAGNSFDSLGLALEAETLKRLDLSGSTVRVVDHYGNLITDAPVPESDRARVLWRGRELRWATTYADGELGEPIALCGSWGTVEIAVNQGSAAELLDARIGDPVDVA